MRSGMSDHFHVARPCSEGKVGVRKQGFGARQGVICAGQVRWLASKAMKEAQKERQAVTSKCARDCANLDGRRAETSEGAHISDDTR